MKEATPRQQEILAWITQFIEKNRYSPTFREIGGYFGFSLKAASDHIQALQRKGFIDYRDGLSRTITIKLKEEIVNGKYL